MAEKEIGRVNHWYDRVSVAVLDLAGPLKVGDTVKVRSGEDEFEATISSMQIDHKGVSSAKKGDEVAVQLPKKAKQGARVYLAG